MTPSDELIQKITKVGFAMKMPTSVTLGPESWRLLGDSICKGSRCLYGMVFGLPIKMCYSPRCAYMIKVNYARKSQLKSFNTIFDTINGWRFEAEYL